METLAPHDPGGKVRVALPGDVIGRAQFWGPNDCYRLWLSRDWSDDSLDQRGVLFIGMNPSTADASVNDPTIGRETFFARREGFKRFAKCNVMDYRATAPKDLRAPGVVPCSDMNLPVIREYAAKASMTVCCWGSLHPVLRRFGDDVETMLRSDGRELLCFGTNADGGPKHPLYLRGDTPLIPFEASR